MPEPELPREAARGDRKRTWSSGLLQDSSALRDDIAALRKKRLFEDGYLFLRGGFHSREEGMLARSVITDRLARNAFPDPSHPAVDAVVSPGRKIVNSKSAFFSSENTDNGNTSALVKN
jgi:hypothetical protein